MPPQQYLFHPDGLFYSQVPLVGKKGKVGLVNNKVTDPLVKEKVRYF